MSEIRIEGVTKRFGKTTAVAGIDLLVRQGEFVSLLGPSGCGKTTLLRLVAGFEAPDSGLIYFDGAAVNDVPAEKRRFGMVFQSYALFPHMTVAENISFGLSIAKVGPRERERKVSEALSLVRLEGYGERKPSQLSGGQKQRVALARAIALDPKILLLDEPLSALDAKIRLFLRGEIRRIQKATGITTLYVTHDQEEALAISDRIVVMCDGLIRQEGSPTAVYDEPADRFVAEFVGLSNSIEGRWEGKTLVLSRGSRLEASGGEARSGAGSAAVRPESIQLIEPAAGAKQAMVNTFTAVVRSIEYLGPTRRIVAEAPEFGALTVDSRGDGYDGLFEGSVILLHIPPAKVRALDA
jgi:putative spermidine/putrescine transport system ATP-binding protein